MMTIEDFKNILLPMEDSFDDYKIILWDYNHQRELEWGGGYAVSKPDKTVCFPVEVPTKDDINIFDRLKEFCKNQQENGICKKDK